MEALMNNTSTDFLVRQVIDCDVRPVLKMHGGGVQIIEITKDNCVQLEFEGTCRECTLQDLMFALSIRQRLLEVPGVSNVTVKGVKVSAVTLERIGQFYKGYSFYQ
jgi:Fe-S cluster biogenesis protein NfuA